LDLEIKRLKEESALEIEKLKEEKNAEISRLKEENEKILKEREVEKTEKPEKEGKEEEEGEEREEAEEEDEEEEEEDEEEDAEERGHEDSEEKEDLEIKRLKDEKREKTVGDDFILNKKNRMDDWNNKIGNVIFENQEMNFFNSWDVDYLNSSHKPNLSDDLMEEDTINYSVDESHIYDLILYDYDIGEYFDKNKNFDKNNFPSFRNSL
jgi:hypothetical protein